MDSILEFNVSNQIIARTDEFEVVADSRNYLYAHFNFLTEEWNDNGTATAIFQNNGHAYNQILDTGNKCLVPYECLETDDKYILVSVFCGDRITANMAKVFVAESGWTDDMEAANPPTPSVYAQIIHRMDDAEDAVEEARDRAETAADKAEAAVEHYPRIIDEYWYVWDVENEEFVNTNIKAEAQDGTSATVSVEPIPDGHRVIITDASGEHIFDVPDGHDGRGISSIQKTGSVGDVDTYTMTFTDGSTFVYQITNGASVTITTTTITGGHRLTITDKNGTRTVDVMDGAKGDPGRGIYNIVKSATYQNIDYYTITYTDGSKFTFSVTNGYSPTVSVTTISGGHRVTITDINGTHSFDVMDGTAGGTTIHICSSSEYDSTTRVPTIQSPQEDVFYLVPAEDGASHDMFVEWIYTNNAWEMFGSASIDLSQYATKTELNGKVDDVQVNGTSVVTDGVAEMPLMDAYSKFGIPKVAAGRGLSISASQKTLYVDFATSDQIKGGTVANMALQTAKQHESTFYGLAKASGDTTQSASSNPVGTYTDEAKTSIRSMLGAASLEEITWSALKAKRDAGTLDKGRQYRITDYVCTTTQEETRAVSHPFDIIVVADDQNTLNENARACLHDGDNYYSVEGSYAKLEAWELKYRINNDTSNFPWVDATNGKGVIYWMKDNFNNECPYDFKQIQFARYEITECEAVPSLVGKYTTSEHGDAITTVDEENPVWCYTFSVEDNGDMFDATVTAGSVFENKISAFSYDSYNILNGIVFIGDDCCSNTFGNYCESNTLGNSCAFNNFGNNCAFNTFGNYCESNTFGDSCTYNTFGNNCTFNTFGNGCYSNTFGNSCYYNTFGNVCESNTFGDSCTYNTFRNGCYSNTFGDSCTYNTFGDVCESNTFGDSCTYNTFGNNCTFNTFGNTCESNTFGDSCTYNTFRNGCYSNTFGNNCAFNTFGNTCKSNTFGDYCILINFGNNCTFNTFGDECAFINFAAGNHLDAAQYYHILDGVQGLDNDYIILNATEGNNYVTHVGRNSNGVLKTWVPADLAP